MKPSGNSENRLAGKVAIITGAARGQGAATAAQFVREGARVVLTDVLDDLGNAMARELGAQATYRRLDVAEEHAWTEVVTEIETSHGHLDILVNNAAITATGPLHEMPLDTFDRLYRINQRGVLLGMRAVHAPMRRTGHGSIINIASGAVYRALPGTLGYTATKHAVQGMTKVAAAEFAPHHIRVNAIHPGLINTPMRDNLTADDNAQRPPVPLGRLGEPDDIAPLAAFLASDTASYITGADFVIDGGFTL